MTLSIVILAAGQGKRMHSLIPKVLHQIAGKPLLEHVVRTALAISSTPPIVIYGHEGTTVQQALAQFNITWIEQTKQLGTGHAVLQALPAIPPQHRVLILYGDVPLITSAALQPFIDSTPAEAVSIMTAIFPDPTGVGRILRDTQNNIVRIVEEKDATPSQRAIQEINSGIYCMPAAYLNKWLPHLNNDNAQHEYYLTDIIGLAAQENIPIHSLQVPRYEEVLGINDCIQLANAERFFQRRAAHQLMQKGVTLIDPNRFDIRGELITGHDVVIDANVIIEGRVVLGNHCKIGPNTLLRNTQIGDHVTIHANCVIEQAEVADHCTVGPFARLRPGTILENHAQIGNFAEIKNSRIGAGSKVHHVSYLGDSEIGKQVNIGAGTITCNYNGVTKQRTLIGDHAFIGSNSTLVAPLTIGEKAYIGAGSTITHHAPQHQLTLGRVKQRSIEKWAGPKQQKPVEES